MVRTRADRHILWPCYFDMGVSRSEGRRVPKALAVKEPTCQEIFEAATGLGLKASLHDDKAHPARWWVHEGRVSVEKTMRKADLIMKVAGRLKDARSAAETPR